MKILILETVPAFGGGSEAVALELCKELSKRGHELFLAYEEEGSMLPVYKEHTKELWKTSFYPFGWRTPVKSLGCVRRLGQFAKSHCIDVIFSTQLSYLRTLALVRAFYKVESVYHLGLPRDVADWSTKWAMNQIFAGIAPSKRTAESWLRCGWPQEKLFIVPNWIDFERFKPPKSKVSTRRELTLPDTAPLLTYVGRIVPEKGIETLIHAFSKVLKIVPSTVLVLVGQISTQYDFALKQTFKQFGISTEHIVKVGISSTPEKYFSAADITVVPSICDESFGLTLVESMACGSLTLVSSFGELPHIIGEENQDLIFSAGDVDALVNSLIYWLSRSEESQKRGHQLHERAVKYFKQSDKVDIYEKTMLTASKKS